MTKLLSEEEYAKYLAEHGNKQEPHPICALLRRLRTEARLSLGQVQEQYGVSAVVLGSYERGDREPPIRKLDAMLRLFGYQLEAVPIDSARDGTYRNIAAELRSLAFRLECLEDTDAVPEVPQPEAHQG